MTAGRSDRSREEDRNGQGDRGGSGGLLAWTLGTFHACTVGLLLLLLIYPRGGLGVLLGGLETVTGLLIFIALWATSVWTARRALVGTDWLSIGPAGRSGFSHRALRWGGATGILFLAELGAIFLVRALIISPRDILVNPLAVLGFAVFVGTFGTVVAFVIGGLTGLVLGAIDLAALALARVTRRSAQPGKG